MITLAYAALWMFVFVVPWEGVIAIDRIAIISRATGMLALGLTLLTVLLTGRVRRWRGFHVAAFLFVICLCLVVKAHRLLIFVARTIPAFHSLEEFTEGVVSPKILWRIGDCLLNGGNRVVEGADAILPARSA